MDIGVVLLHDEGGSVGDMTVLLEALGGGALQQALPEAPGGRWFPGALTDRIERNETLLTASLALVDEAVCGLEACGIARDRVVLGGFGQGASVACEFVARRAERFGGLITLGGGRIGPPNMAVSLPPADHFAAMPVFFGVGDLDPTVTVARVQESGAWFQQAGADVDVLVTPGLGHGVDEAMLARAAEILQRVQSPQS